MISIAIIVAGICAVICVSINAIKSFMLDNSLRTHRDAILALFNTIHDFVEKFNKAYSNTKINFYIADNGLPVLDFKDVEQEDNEIEL